MAARPSRRGRAASARVAGRITTPGPEPPDELREAALRKRRLCGNADLRERVAADRTEPAPDGTGYRPEQPSSSRTGDRHGQMRNLRK
jgi:hypothetical protein